MGCDIHSWAEVRRAGAWCKLGRVWPCWYEDDGLTDAPYWTRDYDTFAILAGVRNRDRRITPIAEPRDWPADVTDEGKQEYDEFAEDGHSFSWHSLRQLLEYPLWHTTFTQEGRLNGPAYRALKKDGVPDEWWGIQYSRGTTISEDELVRELALGNDARELFIHTSWAVPYRRAAEEFVTDTIPRLLALAAPEPCALAMAELALAGEKTALLPLRDWLEENDRPGLDDVRMVFFFDN
jgi:hypothetical protein